MAERGGRPLYQVADLTVSFATGRGLLQAVRGVDLELHAGEVVGIVGESGSGKSVTALALLRLLPPHARITARRLRFRGEDLVTMRPPELQRLRGGQVGMIFQEPAGSFDPIYTIGRSLAETLRTPSSAASARGAAPPRRGAAAGSGDCAGRAPPGQLSPPVLRRHAAAGDDRAPRWPATRKC